MPRASIVPAAGLLVAAAVLFVALPRLGRTGDVDAVTRLAEPIAPAARGTLPDLTGMWEGAWADTVFFVGGTLSFDITQNGNLVTGTGTIGLQALGLGERTGTASGTISGSTMTFSFSADSVGMGNGTLNGGTGSGTGNVTAPLNFGNFTFDGVATDVSIAGTFGFTNPGSGGGTGALTKTSAVEDRSWSGIKAAYHVDGE
ncbi:MAG: hypothetical protein R3B81_14735 [bacterium]